MVIVFDEDAPELLIASIQPNILAKGWGYTLETVVSADLVESWGGKVMLEELKETL